LVFCTKKNLATLLFSPPLRAGWPEFRPLGDCLLLGPILGYFPARPNLCHYFDKNGFDYILGNFSQNYLVTRSLRTRHSTEYEITCCLHTHV
jgi:hypothetical protein